MDTESESASENSRMFKSGSVIRGTNPELGMGKKVKGDRGVGFPELDMGKEAEGDRGASFWIALAANNQNPVGNKETVPGETQSDSGHDPLGRQEGHRV